ncbi:MAG: insulinase family protein [Acidobacteriia bacterium]|nr:insulinase family protein [Terriglobia bacterium]
MRTTSLGVALSAAALAALLAVPAAAQVENYKDIKYPPLPEFRIEKPAVYTLKNGMTVFLMEDHELPLIEVSARIRTGSAWEPAEKTGLAGLTGTVQRTGGTSSMTGDDIDDFLANRAASVETGIDDDSGHASMNCLKDNFEEVFKVFADVLRAPAFAQDKLDLAKVQANTGIARRNDQVMGILFREFPRLVYGKDSPLTRNEEYATVAAVNRDDLVAWHKKYYVPNNVYLGIVGDFDPKEMKKKVDAVFGDWTKGPTAPLPPIPFRTTPNPGVYFIEKSDVTQAYVAMGHLGIERKNPDYFAVQVMNEVLGGSFASRMFSNVRSKKGLAYNVFGNLSADYLYPGVLRAGLQTKSSTMAQGVEAVKAEVVGIIENPPNDDEMKRAKDAILNSFVFNYDSKAKTLNQQMTYAFYGLPADYLEQYRANIEKVTRQDVERVAKKYVHPDQMTLLVVGKKDEFDKPVSTFGKVTDIDISIPPPPDKTPKAAKTSASLAVGRALLASVVGALGGKNPGDVKAIETSAKLVLSVRGQTMQMARTKLLVFPDRVHQVSTSAMGEQTLVVTGGEGFRTAGGNTSPLPPTVVEMIQKETMRDLRVLVRYASDPGMEAVAAGEETVDGTKCQVVSVSFKGSDCRLFVAPDGRVLKEAYQGVSPLTMAPAQIEVLFSDYHEVEGRSVPHKEVVRVDGEDAITLTLESFKVDPPVDEKLFQKPAEKPAA